MIPWIVLTLVLISAVVVLIGCIQEGRRSKMLGREERLRKEVEMLKKENDTLDIRMQLQKRKEES